MSFNEHFHLFWGEGVFLQNHSTHGGGEGDGAPQRKGQGFIRSDTQRNGFLDKSHARVKRGFDNVLKNIL